MEEKEKKQILDKAYIFFKTNIIDNHIKNSLKATRLSAYKVNPFTCKYLANFLCGDDEPKSIAKALLYPRILGTSISTSFGTNLQKFCSDVLESYGSAIEGIDIEFIDNTDDRKKYCQLKAGPNCINKDDVVTISNHFGHLRRIALTNNLQIGIPDQIIGVFYGENKDLSAHYKKLAEHYIVLVGQNFWTSLTGDENFYFDLIDCL